MGYISGGLSHGNVLWPMIIFVMSLNMCSITTEIPAFSYLYLYLPVVSAVLEEIVDRHGSFAESVYEDRLQYSLDVVANITRTS